MTAAPDIRQRLSRAGRANVLMTVTVLVASFVTQAWIGRRLGPSGLGEYNGTSLFVTVISVLCYFGLPLAISQRIARSEETGGTRSAETVGAACTISLLLAFVAGAVAASLWSVFARASSIAHPAPVLIVAAAAFGMIVQYFAVSVLLAKLRLALVTLIALAQPAAVAIAIALTYSAVGLDGSSIAVIASVSTGLAGAAYLVAARVAPRIDVAEMRRLFAHAMPGTTVLYISLLTGWIDRLVVALVTGPNGLGPYAAASYLVEGALRLPRNSGQLSVAAYARLTGDVVGIQRVQDSHVRILAAFFLIAGATFIAAGQGLILTIFGGGFNPATTTLQLLAMALLPMGIAFAIASSGAGLGELRLPLPLMLLILISQVVAAIVGAAWFSIAGVALAELIVWNVALVVYVMESQRRSVPFSISTLLRIAGVAAPVFALALIVGRSPLPLVLQIAIGVAASSLGSFAVLLRAPERRLLRRLIQGGGPQ